MNQSVEVVEVLLIDRQGKMALNPPAHDVDPLSGTGESFANHAGQRSGRRGEQLAQMEINLVPGGAAAAFPGKVVIVLGVLRVEQSQHTDLLTGATQLTGHLVGDDAVHA